jgi:predicted DNA-binding transcriptional regulator AlpA
MTVPHLFRSYRANRGLPGVRLGVSRRYPEGLAHLPGMDIGQNAEPEGPRSLVLEQVVSLTDLCRHLNVSVQTLYDLRSQGRGPRGFRVGRELRFRISEIEAWLARMESNDGERQSDGGR